jgi:hypothetical protein
MNTEGEVLLAIRHSKDNGTGMIVYAEIFSPGLGEFWLDFMKLPDNHYFKSATMKFSGDVSRLSVEVIDTKQGQTLFEYAESTLVGALRIEGSGQIITTPKGSLGFCYSMLEDVLNMGGELFQLNFKMENTLENIAKSDPGDSLKAVLRQLKPHIGKPYSGRICDYFPAVPAQNHNV